ncbi:thymidine phosphorylase [Loktanella sp. D2R18]|uniref:thymidine phosphorylase n=1 Tax=Rhodobacterales TaxID=204455 RepID=UPI000DEB4A47|nr:MULTISPECIES: thymidine phosphorylase [Rhodobacterales]MDO6589009.1 thymidine phosphorylase [Yoonia sp. 1_MG-2023]RBW41776.1 thymidine phosphorylase [Loktanella sp. D2R18]
MDARAIISAIRRKKTPADAELAWFANGLATGAVSDAQAGAFAMAVCLNGLSDAGRVSLTKGMRDSGDVLHWDLPGPVLDKHSTGGVGDCVSLILAPILAACGVYVPMISGRGLGHTGGTLDKLEAIPGLSVDVNEAKLRQITCDVGCTIVSATGQIAPADKRLYAIRDVTATVESVDLITASILAKKLAAGLEGLILDVKCGSGAFMKTPDDARVLARALTDASNGAGCKTESLITDMNAPLAPALGNALEVAVCMEVLSGNIAAAPRLYELTVSLCERLLAMRGITDAKIQITTAISSGAAMEKFSQMVAALGGPPDMADDWHTHLPKAPIVKPVRAPIAGHVAAINGEALGLAVVTLGGGRRVETDKINPSVGFTDMIGLGQAVAKNDPLCMVHAATDAQAAAASAAVQGAITIGDPVPPGPLIIERIT